MVNRVKLKFIVVLVFFNLFISTGLYASNETREGRITLYSQVYALAQQEAKLRNTYSFQSLWLAKAVGGAFLDSARGPWEIVTSVLQTACQHNASAIVRSIGHRLLPRGWHSTFDWMVGAGTSILHVCHIIQNPLEQIGAYGLGMVGVEISERLLANSNLSPEIQKELLGALYFISREVGMAAGQSTQEVWTNCFRVTQKREMTLKDKISSRAICPSNFQPEEILDCAEAGFVSTKISQQENTSFYFIPECITPKYIWESERMFNRTIPHIIKKIEHVQKSGQSFTVLVGEDHYDCSTKLFEERLFAFLSCLPAPVDVQDAFVELPARTVFVMLNEIHLYEKREFAVSSKCTALFPEENQNLAARCYWLQATKSPLDYELKVNSLENGERKHNWRMGYYWFGLNRAKDEKLKDRHPTHQICPDFLEDDKIMAHNIIQKGRGKNNVAVVGASHVSGILADLKNKDPSRVVVAINTNNRDLKAEEAFRAKISVLEEAFDAECAEKFESVLDAENDVYDPALVIQAVGGGPVRPHLAEDD